VSPGPPSGWQAGCGACYMWNAGLFSGGCHTPFAARRAQPLLSNRMAVNGSLARHMHVIFVVATIKHSHKLNGLPSFL
jgi:hypothetical protein